MSTVERDEFIGRVCAALDVPEDQVRELIEAERPARERNLLHLHLRLLLEFAHRCADEIAEDFNADLQRLRQARTEGSEGSVEVIRSLGFVGNMHYCPDCMRHFHDCLGQHAPDCELIAGLIAELGEDEASE